MITDMITDVLASWLATIVEQDPVQPFRAIPLFGTKNCPASFSGYFYQIRSLPNSCHAWPVNHAHRKALFRLSISLPSWTHTASSGDAELPPPPCITVDLNVPRSKSSPFPIHSAPRIFPYLSNHHPESMFTFLMQ